MSEEMRNNGMPEGAISAVDLVAYQPGSVVSRQLVKQEKGSVTAFAFSAGEGLSEHTAPFDALAQVLERNAEITVSGKVH